MRIITLVSVGKAAGLMRIIMTVGLCGGKKRMIGIYIAVFVIVYIVIGGFIAGIMHADYNNDGFELFVIFFWPLVLAVFVVLAAVKLPLEVGKKVGEWIEQRTTN